MKSLLLYVYIFHWFIWRVPIPDPTVTSSDSFQTSHLLEYIHRISRSVFLQWSIGQIWDSRSAGMCSGHGELFSNISNTSCIICSMCCSIIHNRVSAGKACNLARQMAQYLFLCLVCEPHWASRTTSPVPNKPNHPLVDLSIPYRLAGRQHILSLFISALYLCSS